ncbi:FUSC family protein [Eubacterium oxidoreducens]|uniref:Fusaric acid resistance protein-like n=1 Tax=Eubacterium oxidoreducens TaxID=1732 RepID=A0A1G6CA17_EUBOX|nr:FUSC family protein [Eubacterium oxidoreducens]SDB29727.1 Fusaric acid resistance protein-like [Eubacterium oxidoreducens]
MHERLKLYIRKNVDLTGAIAPTIVVTGIFFVIYYFFGIENTIIGPCVTLSYLYFAGLSNHYASMVKTFLIYMVLAVAAYVAGLSLPFAIVVNAAVFFWIVYHLIDEYHPDNYYTPGMAFILFQLSPVSGMHGLSMRLIALILSFAIAFLVLLLLPSRHNKNDVRKLVGQGFEIGNQLCEAYVARDKVAIEQKQQLLHLLNEQICDEIYLYNYAGFRKENKVNWYCRFVALFQVLTVLAEHEDVEEKSEQMRNMLVNFKALYEADKANDFSKKLVFKKEKPDIHSFTLRFALRMLIVMTACMIYGYICPWGNGFWLAVSVYFMMVPLYENITGKIKGRLLGTIAGVILCFLLFTVFPSQPAHVVILIIFNFLINSSKNYATTVAYLTCAVLALNITPDNIGFTLLERLIYTFGGAGLTLLGCRFIFPIRIQPEADYLLSRLNMLREQMQRIRVYKGESPEELRHERDQLLVRSYLLSRRLRRYNQALPHEKRNLKLIDVLNEHMSDMSMFLVHHFIGIKSRGL